jgi:hypothetical protein
MQFSLFPFSSFRWRVFDPLQPQSEAMMNACPPIHPFFVLPSSGATLVLEFVGIMGRRQHASHFFSCCPAGEMPPVSFQSRHFLIRIFWRIAQAIYTAGKINPATNLLPSSYSTKRWTVS